MPKIIDITGQRFGRLTVLEFAGIDKHGDGNWKCTCDCGTEKVVVGFSMKSGNTLSCGCLLSETVAQRGRDSAKHGMCYSRLYHTWAGMRQRCDGTSAGTKVRYHDRGIRVCDDWNGSFIPFMDWALSNGYQDDLTIDRINNDGNYEPDNCRWASRLIQANNTSSNRMVTFDGKTMTMAESAREQGITYATLQCRERKKRLVNA